MKVEKPERLLNLIAMLLASRVPVPFSAIAGRVIGYDDDAKADALEKRFDRDRADLRELGVHVEYEEETGELPAGYVIRKDATFQRRITVTDEEAALLSVAGRIGAAATGGGALTDALKSALRKLAVDVPFVGPEAGGDSPSVLRVDAGDPRAREAITTIAQAIARPARIRFRYQGVQDEAPRRRTVSPWGLGLFRGSWYAAAFDHDRRGVRVFKVARITGRVERRSDEKPQEPAPDFRMEDHLPKEAHDVGPGEPTAVVLRIQGAPDRAAFAPGLKPEVLSDDGRTCVVSLRVRRPEALVPWVLQSGGAVVVEKPASLRQAVLKAARAILREGAR